MLELLKRHAGTLRLLFGLGVCALLFCFLDPAVVGSTLLQTNALWYSSAYPLFLGVMVLRALRWRGLLKDLGLHALLSDLIRIHLIGCYLNLFVPGGIAGDAYKIYDIKNTRSKSLRPFFATLVERLTGIGTLAGISFFSSLYFREQLPVSPYVLMTLSGTLLAVCLFSLILLPHTAKILRSFSFFIPHRLNVKIPWEKLSSLHALSLELRNQPALYIRVLGISLILQIFVLSIYYVIGNALDSRITLWQVMVFFPLIDLTAMIPITVNGLGIKEGLLIYFMNQNGLPPSFSMSFAILCRLMETAFALLGGLLFHFKKKEAQNPE